MKLEPIVKTYYDGLEEGKLLGRRCLACGAIEFPPHPACNTCGNRDTEWCEVSGKGVMTSFVTPGVINDRPYLRERGPYAFAAVTLEDGPEMNVVVYGVNPENEHDLKSRLRSGSTLPVHPVIVQRNGYKTLNFELE